MKKESKVSNGNGGKMIAMGAGVAALAVASYFLLGPSGKTNQKKIKSWMVKMKGGIGEKLENLQEVSEPIYQKIIDGAAKAYATAQSVDKSELAAYVKNLKEDWQHIAKSAKKVKKSVKATSPKKKSSKK